MRSNGLAVGVVVLAMAGVAHAQLAGAVFTTVANGTAVNANQYDWGDQVYVGGGPQHAKSKGLTDGTYYFQVTTPAGALVSSDDAVCRQVVVVAGRVAGAAGPCAHAVGTRNPTSGATPVQLWPFDCAAQGEYKVWLVAQTARTHVDAANPRALVLDPRDSKTDNFKVGTHLGVTCPEGATVECDGGAGDAQLDDPSVRASCGEASWTTSVGPFAYLCGSSEYTVGVTATNGAASASCSTSVTVEDTLAPVLACPARTVIADDHCQAPAPEVHAADLCDGTLFADCAPARFDGTGAHAYSCGAADCTGNAATCAGTVTVVDRTPPAALCPPSQVLECTGPCATLATVAAGASDGCGASAGCAPGTGAYCLGTTANTCAAVDGAGNRGTCATSVTVVDTHAPAMTCAPARTVFTSARPGNLCSATLAASARAADGCDGELGASCATPVLSLALPGSVSTECAAADASGNAGTCSTSLTLVDDSAPALRCPAPRTVVADAQCKASVAVAAAATDNCDGSVAAACAPSVLSFSGPGTASAQCSASDAAGNPASCATSVTVVDTTAPVVTCSVAKPVLSPPNHKIVVDVGLTVSASDNCSAAPAVRVVGVTSDEPTATVLGAGGPAFAPDAFVTGTTVQLRSERSGLYDGRVYVITVAATDAAGNTGTATCRVRVDASEGNGVGGAKAGGAVDSGQRYDATKTN